MDDSHRSGLEPGAVFGTGDTAWAAAAPAGGEPVAGESGEFVIHERSAALEPGSQLCQDRAMSAKIEPRFSYARDVRFSCTRCGDCCRTWNVMLGPGERDRLAGLDWREREDDLVDLEPAITVRPAAGPQRERLQRRADGSCVYLGEKNQCRIHQHFGAEAKPLLCRLYPFGFYPVADRISIDVSFACRAVSEGSGAFLNEREPEWAQLLKQASSTGRKHFLRHGVEIDGALLFELEHHLLSLLEHPELDFFARVRSWLQFAKIATTGDPHAATAAPLRQAMVKGIPIQMAQRAAEIKGKDRPTMDRTQKTIFFQWLYLHLNPPPFDLDRRPEIERQKEARRRVDAGKPFLKAKGRPRIEDRELETTFAEIDRVEADVFARPELTSPLELFLKAKILGQRFLVVAEAELPFTEALPKFLLAVPMALWTAKALAAENGAPRIEPGDVRRALRLVDRTLGLLPTDALPKKQARACDFIMLETDLVEAAILDLTLVKEA